MGYTAIVDYGVGNLKSVTNAMTYVGLTTRITGDSGELERADAILLPGVGAFPDAVERLRATGLDKVLLALAGHKPILGICLGMQLLFDESNELRSCKGLGLVAGSVEKIVTSAKLPHIGWNGLTFPNPSPLFQGLTAGDRVYFVHSFCGMVAEAGDVIATTDHGTEVLAAVNHNHVYGCQFHPEKSGEVGLQILKNFGELSR